jgi:hypothetical protein
MSQSWANLIFSRGSRLRRERKAFGTSSGARQTKPDFWPTIAVCPNPYVAYPIPYWAVHTQFTLPSWLCHLRVLLLLNRSRKSSLFKESRPRADATA